MKAALLLLLFILHPAACTVTSLPPVNTTGFALGEDEIRIWKRSGEEQSVLHKSGLIYKDEPLEAYLNEVARRLQPRAVLIHIPFRIFIIKNHLLNAFAFPDGGIYLHTGILARMENEAQLATLLAHEMTHATHRHAIKRFREMKNQTAALAAMHVALGGTLGNPRILLGPLGTLAAVSGYSQALETEADLEGFRLLVKAGYSLRESPKLFEHLKKEKEEEKAKEPFFFGTHPRLQERSENYRKLLAQNERGGLVNSELFLAQIHPVILQNAFLDLQAGRFAAAQRGADKYLSLKPDDAGAYSLRGDICRQRGEENDSAAAEANYQKALSLDPAHPVSYKGLGLLYYKQGRKSLAKPYLESYLLYAPQASDREYVRQYLKECE